MYLYFLLLLFDLCLSDLSCKGWFAVKYISGDLRTEINDLINRQDRGGSAQQLVSGPVRYRPMRPESAMLKETVCAVESWRSLKRFLKIILMTITVEKLMSG